jgi:hypothetical protein
MQSDSQIVIEAHVREDRRDEFRLRRLDAMDRKVAEEFREETNYEL